MYLVFVFGIAVVNGNETSSMAYPVLSILDFTDHSMDPDLRWLSAGLSDMLVTDLAATELTVVDRDDLEAVFAEQSLALSGITEEKALEIGRLLSADALLVGSYALSEGILRLDVRISGVVDGSVIASATVSGPTDTVFKLEAELARKVCTAMGVSVPPGLEIPETLSLPAARAYYEGIVLQSTGEVEAARKRFEEASNLDPLYVKPRLSMEDSWRLLEDFRRLRQQRELNTLWRKAEALKSRLSADPFVSDSDAIIAAYTAGTPTVQIGSPPADNPSLGSCPNPAVCLWNLQITYWEIGSTSQEYFDDTRTKNAAYQEVIRLADQAEAAWPDDEWLPEIIYWRVLTQRWLEDWPAVKAGCERFFVEWPDFRMNWALEDLYTAALEALGR